MRYGSCRQGWPLGAAVLAALLWLALAGTPAHAQDAPADPPLPGPETQIDSAPPAHTAAGGATIAFSAPGALAPTFECSLGGADFASCESPLQIEGLTDGEHHFAVRAVDPLLGADPTPATHTWTVDTVRPSPHVVSGPPPLTNAASAAFTYASDDASATVECSLDLADPWHPCAPSYEVGEGDHDLRVRATDAAGNAGLASHRWTVDLTAPVARIDLGTSGVVGSSAAAFSFGADEGGVSFRCSLDGSPAEPCTSPARYTGLADGAHAFAVFAVDAAGNEGAAASARWSVSTLPPETPFLPPPAPAPDEQPAQQRDPQQQAPQRRRRSKPTHVSNERTRTWWSRIRHRGTVFRRASRDSRREGRLARFTYYGFTDVVVVLKRIRGWTKIRYSGLGRRTGWVRTAALSRPRLTRTRIVVDRKRFTLTAYRNGKRVFRTRVGVGAKGSPTPAGRFFMRERLVPRDQTGIYGALAWGTSTYSRFRTDWPGGGQIGIHGTNQPGLIPGRISNGCVRLPNRSIRRLDRIVGKGTPVRVR